MSQLLVTEVVAFSLRVIPMVFKGEAKSQGYKVKGLGLGNESLEVGSYIFQVVSWTNRERKSEDRYILHI